MPGPIATVQRVRDLGGLIDTAPAGSTSGIANFYAHNLFGYPDDPTLVTRIQTEINLASSWLQSRAGNDYAIAAGGSDPIRNALFGEAEAWLALQQLYETLRMRKALGIHFPFLNEESDRFENLIRVGMPEHIKKFVEQYLVDDEGKPFAAPVMVFTPVIDRTLPSVESERAKLDDIIDEATGLPVPVFPLSTDGQSGHL